MENLKKIAQYYNIGINKLTDDDEKIIISDNEINGENNLIGNINNVNIQQSPQLIELIVKNQEQISKNQEQNTQLIEIQLKLIELMNKKN